ncbi:MAG: hypothetical protein Q8L14_13375 [Myxococcales bacterium]|nr:hypothetical protein [Myxococcales bacterium]
MPAPVVCPNCSRVFAWTMSACPQCGWASTPQGTAARLGKIELVKGRSEASLELPPEPTTGPGARAGVAAPPTRLEFPEDAPGSIPAVRASVSPAAVESGSAARLELPPDDDAGIPELAPLPLPTDGDAPPAPHFQTFDDGTITLPAWLTEPLDSGARQAAALTAPLVVLAAIDAVTAGRPELSAGSLWLQALLLTGATAGLVIGHRAGAIAATGAGLIGISSFGPSGLAFAVWTAAVVSICVTVRGRAVALAAGLGAIAVVAPAMVDGMMTRPVLGELRAALDGIGPPLKWPVIDQHHGLQLSRSDASLRMVTSTAAESRLTDPERGLEVALRRLPPGLELTAATRESQLWLETLGLSQLQFGHVAELPGEFDASTVTVVSARARRATLSGFVRVCVIGNDAFAIATWTRAHRSGSLTPVMQQVVDGVRYRPAARPHLPADRRASVSQGLVTSSDGRLVGVRVNAGDRTLLLIPAAVGGEGVLQLKSEQGPFPVDLSKARVSNGVRVALLGGGATVPMRAAIRAPRLSRVVVAGGWSGGWLSDEPGAPIRAVDLIDGRPGPAFDLDGQLIGMVIAGTSGLALVTVDSLFETMVAVAGSAPRLAEANQEPPPPLFEPLGEEERRAPSSASDVLSSVVLARSAAGLTGAVVIGQGQAAWVLVADAAVAPPGVLSVSVRLPSTAVRVADVVRVVRGVALLKLPREDGDGLRVMKLVEGAPLASARRVAWGFRDDPATATVALKSTHGLLSPTEFEPEPGPALSTGPVVSPDNRLAGLRLSGSQSIVEGAALQGLGVAGLTDVVWRIAAEPTGTCQLAATIELEDPLEEATQVRVRVEPATDGAAPSRVKAAAFTDVAPLHGRASFIYRFPCFTTPQWLQFEVQGPSGVRWSQVQRVPVATTLPGVIRGRAGASEGASRGPSALVAELWELPAPVTNQHPCRTQPSLCERACVVDELDACTLDGRQALATKEVGRAVSRFDAMCEAGDLEACTLLPWAVAETKKPGRALRSKAESLLVPWCQAGLRRACVAMAIPEWRKTLTLRTSACVANPRACGALGVHLLDGPRLDAELTRALKLLQQACGAGDVESCAHSGIESLRFGREEPLAVMPRLQRACDARIADACTALALNAARGITVPRMPQAAEQQLDEACRLGSTDACLMTGRP